MSGRQVLSAHCTVKRGNTVNPSDVVGTIQNQRTDRWAISSRRIMKQIAIAPPPLPPKMRRSPPERTTTVLADSQENHHQSHVVKIRINPTKSEIASVTCDVAPRISISVNSEGDMIQKSNGMEVEGERSPYFFFGSYNCNVMSSGQVSPSDTLDSGTCSDLDGTPPPLPKKKGNGITVTVINGHHKRVTSSTSSGVDLDSDDNESSISYDSLNSGELHQDAAVVSLTSAVAATTIKPQESSGGGLPQGLLQDIRQRNVKLLPTETVLKNSVETTTTNTSSPATTIIVDESTYEERKEKEKQDMCVSSLTYDTDCYYNFHLNENQEEEEVAPVTINENETFAGYKDILSDGSSTIRSAKGTVRGVKNRVRAGIATFLQINCVTKVSHIKSIISSDLLLKDKTNSTCFTLST